MYLGAEWIWNLTLNLRSPQFYDEKTDNTTAALMLAPFNMEPESVHTLQKRGSIITEMMSSQVESKKMCF